MDPAHAPRRLLTLQIGTGWFPENAGGLDRFYYNLVSRLPALGVEVRGLVAGSAEVERSSSGSVSAFAPLDDFLPRRLTKARAAISKAIAHYRPDLVSAHFALFAAPALDLLADQPFVIQFQGPWAQEVAAETDSTSPFARAKCAMMYRLERAVYRRACRFIVLSDAFGQILHRSYGVPEALIRKAPGGVEAERFAIPQSSTDARRELGLPMDRPVIVAVRRLARRMGLENLIDAVAEVRRRFPDLLLLVAGKGDLAAELQRRIDEAGLAHHVRLLGFVPDERLPLLYRSANFSIVPTLALEGFGLTTVESLAAGTPVLVTPVGALPEVVEGLSADLILSTSSPAGIAQGLIEALSGARRLPSSEQCMAYVEGRFTWDVVALRTRDIYREVLS